MSGRENPEVAMAFFLKPRPCTWDLALDYHTAKQFEGNQRWLERGKVPVPCVLGAEMFNGVGDPPPPPSVSLGPPSPTSLSLLFHLQPQLDICPPSPNSTSSHLNLQPHLSSPFLFEKPPVKVFWGCVFPRLKFGFWLIFCFAFQWT